jgi:spermidine synthase
MQQPLWKKWLSYVYELHIESTSSEFNPHLYVSLRDGRYQLCTANAIYSFEDRYDNFTEAFKSIDLNKLPGTRVLVLGFGLASVPLILEKKLHKQYHYTGIEIDEEVLYLANKYIMDELDSNFDLIAADAHTFAMLCQEQFDLVIMDVFFDDLIPDEFETPEFLERLKAITKPEGLMLYNRLAFNDRDIKTSKAFYDNTFKKIFQDGTFLEVKGNWMLVNNKQFVNG